MPFLKSGVLAQKHLPLPIGLTLVAPVSGACLLRAIPSRAMPTVIAVAMIVVAAFSLLKRKAGPASRGEPSRASTVAGYELTFFLGVYGGFFSGGYVTILTAALVALSHMSFIEAVAVTKVLNMVSSIVATIVFAFQVLIE
jgi:uncharacterized protein